MHTLILFVELIFGFGVTIFLCKLLLNNHIIGYDKVENNINIAKNSMKNNANSIQTINQLGKIIGESNSKRS